MAADDTLEKVKTNTDTDHKSEFEKLLELYDYKFSKGDLVKGTVVGFESNGVLIDIGAKTAGKVPLKEVSNIYSKTPQDVLKVGDVREFLIIKEEDEEGQLTLSLKKVASVYSWKKLEELKEEDAVVEAEVTATVKGGILVDVLGLRGFVPSSHIRTRDAESLVGQTLQLKILSVDAQQNNLIMSHRKVVSDQQADQRKNVFDRLHLNQIIEGEVVRLADFGAFIDIGGIDGLLPLSQMSWRWVDHPADILTVGQKINVQIIGIDEDKQRVSLSLKSMQPDPWEEAAKVIKENDKITGTVIRIKHFGAFIEVYPGVEALLPYREVMEYQHQSGTPLEVGKSIQATVIRFNPEDRRISLSVTGKISDADLEEVEKVLRKSTELEFRKAAPSGAFIKKEQKPEQKQEEDKSKSDKETEEPDVTDNEGVTHISPPCNEG